MKARKHSPLGMMLMLCLTAALLAALGGPALAAPSESLQVWRMQIFFQTSSHGDAATDDTIRVEVNDNPLVQTALDSPKDDFERSSQHTYELRLNGINTLSDLRYLKIFKDGSDGWCIKSLRLIVNGNPILIDTFPGSGHWLDNEGGASRTLLYSDWELRGSPTWQNYTPLYWAPYIPDMATRLEGIVGHHITGNALAWGPELYGACVGGPCAVEVSRKNDTTLHVDLDLEINLPVDVDFDAEVLCGNGTLSFQLKNITFVASPFAFNEVKSILTTIMPRIQQDMTQVLRHHAIYPQSCYAGWTFVAGQGSVHFPTSGPPSPPGGPVIYRGPFVFTPIPTRSLIASAAPAAAAASDSAEARAPLALRVELPDQARPGEPVTLAYRLRSGLAAGADVDLQFELPSEIQLLGAAVEVTDERGSRLLAPDLVSGTDGSVRLSLRDQVGGGQEAEYRLRVCFVGAEDAEVVALASATVAPLEGEPTAVEAASSFSLRPDLAQAKITGISSGRPPRGITK
jgi:hypothetical protein